MWIAHAGELRGCVCRALVQTLVLMQRKKDTDTAICAALWVGSEVAYFQKVCDKFIQIIGIVNVWLKVFWVFMSTWLSVSGDVYYFEPG